MAALYWRVKGQGKRAIDCLRQALNYAPHHMKASVLLGAHNASLAYPTPGNTCHRGNKNNLKMDRMQNRCKERNRKRGVASPLSVVCFPGSGSVPSEIRYEDSWMPDYPDPSTDD